MTPGAELLARLIAGRITAAADRLRSTFVAGAPADRRVAAREELATEARRVQFIGGRR